MTLTITRKPFVAALLAASLVGAVAVPTAAQAGHSGNVAAGVAIGALGGLAVGSAIERDRYDRGGGYYVRERRVRDCWTERRRVVDDYGYEHIRRVRVCD